jgi:predicted enzyme related to lactoylglutathione lyase
MSRVVHFEIRLMTWSGLNFYAAVFGWGFRTTAR